MREMRSKDVDRALIDPRLPAHLKPDPSKMLDIIDELMTQNMRMRDRLERIWDELQCCGEYRTGSGEHSEECLEHPEMPEARICEDIAETLAARKDGGEG